MTEQLYRICYKGLLRGYVGTPGTELFDKATAEAIVEKDNKEWAGILHHWAEPFAVTTEDAEDEE